MTVPVQSRYFLPAGETAWHAYRDDSPAALCGEARITYNVDQIADDLPFGAALHEGCRRALEPETVAETPKTISTPKTSRKTKPKA